MMLVVLWQACASSETESVDETVEQAAEETAPEGTPFAVIRTDRGSFEFELFPDVAPKSVGQFINLAEQGFYVNTTFHRVLKDRLIQGGDPMSRDRDPYNDGQGNSGRMLPAEFSDLLFERGTVAMARQSGDPNSGSSQFFVSLQRAPEWDGQYTVIGKVVSGIEVVEEISRTPTSQDPQLKGRPTGNIRIKEVMIEYRNEAEDQG